MNYKNISICIYLILNLTGCAQMMPGLFQAVEDIETDTAIRLEVDKSAIQKETDININIQVTNKDAK